jgi:hypothetical protein
MIHQVLICLQELPIDTSRAALRAVIQKGNHHLL